MMSGCGKYHVVSAHYYECGDCGDSFFKPVPPFDRQVHCLGCSGQATLVGLRCRRCGEC